MCVLWSYLINPGEESMLHAETVPHNSFVKGKLRSLDCVQYLNTCRSMTALKKLLEKRTLKILLAIECQ